MFPLLVVILPDAGCDGESSVWDDAPHCCALMRYHNHARSCEWVPEIVRLAESKDEATSEAEYAELYTYTCDDGYGVIDAYSECQEGKTP